MQDRMAERMFQHTSSRAVAASGTGGRGRRLCWPLSLAIALSGSCSVLLDTSKQQCASDTDCQARGLTGSVCVDNLCQLVGTAAAGRGAGDLSVEGEAGATGAAGASGAGASGSRAQTPSRAGTSGRPQDETMDDRSDDAPDAADGEGEAPGSSGANAGAAGMSEPDAGSEACDDSSCAECSVAADCEKLGITDGSCIDGKCWAQPPQCEADEDCAELGAEYVGGLCQERQCFPNPRWRCEPVPMRSAEETIELTLPVIDALRLELVPDVPLTACGKLDYTCERPFTSGVTGPDGRAKLMVPGNFAGYVQQNERREYAPGTYFMPVRLPIDGELSNFPVISTSALGGLALSLGTSLDPERGHIMLVVEDCMGAAVPGVQFTSPQIDDRTVQFYTRDQIPTTSAMDTPPEGTAGFVNLPMGVAEITATELSTGVRLATVSVLVRPGAIAMSYVRPETRGTTITGRNPD